MTTTTIKFKGYEAKLLLTGTLPGAPNFSALTEAGKLMSQGALGSQSKRKHTGRWQEFYAALGAADLEAIVKLARVLPSVKVSLTTNRFTDPNCGFRVIVGKWTVIQAALVEIRRTVDWKPEAEDEVLDALAASQSISEAEVEIVAEPIAAAA